MTTPTLASRRRNWTLFGPPPRRPRNVPELRDRRESQRFREVGATGSEPATFSAPAEHRPGRDACTEVKTPRQDGAFQPAQMGAFSTGLDKKLEIRPLSRSRLLAQRSDSRAREADTRPRAGADRASEHLLGIWVVLREVQRAPRPSPISRWERDGGSRPTAHNREVGGSNPPELSGEALLRRGPGLATRGFRAAQPHAASGAREATIRT